MGADRTCEYLGLSLSGPLVASSSPLTEKVETALALQEAGVSAIVLPSLFAEEVEDEEFLVAELMDEGDAFAEFNSSPLPLDGDLGPARHVKQVAELKAALEIPVIASVNAMRPGSWHRYATMLADAGADAIELNLYSVAADPRLDSAEMERIYLEIIESVRESVQVPLALKLSPYFSSLAGFAPRAKAAGIDGLVLFNRFYGADLDLEQLAVKPRLALSSPDELRLPLRWVAILSAQLPELSYATTSGVHGGADIAKSLLVGANVAYAASSLLRNGPKHAATMLAEFYEWLDTNCYDSISQLRGSMNAASVPNPSEFERAQYMEVLTAR